MNGWTLAAWTLFCLEARDSQTILIEFRQSHEDFGAKFGVFTARAVDGLVKLGISVVDANFMLASVLPATHAECDVCGRMRAVEELEAGSDVMWCKGGCPTGKCCNCYRDTPSEKLIAVGSDIVICEGCDAGVMYAPVVRRAFYRMNVEPCRNRVELAWRVAVAAVETRWDDSYESNSARRLAYAILVDDEENQESNALWLVDANAAMDAAMARLNAPAPVAEPVLEQLGAAEKLPAIETDRCAACGAEVAVEDLDVVDDCDKAVCGPCMALVAEELADLADTHRDAWIEAMEARAAQVQREPWPEGSRLLWEIDPEEWVAIDARPRNDQYDSGEAA